ncbi:IQ domain-containing protein IQM4-like [Papaver somniferum]|uniref:IQ domain-containing protein IQM4-like n=1 Tax=Papaver somniferum TaxID=3469 RepID=UPI000E6FF4B6|nr:IQ domain-containing protein IQM4-like [Papaver somniferum]
MNMGSSITSKSKEQNSLIAPKDPKLIIPAVEPPKFCSPRPVSELDAAAVKLKSYGTRRNLPDCAVVVEALCIGVCCSQAKLGIILQH